jgi:hypothetical protein
MSKPTLSSSNASSNGQILLTKSSNSNTFTQLIVITNSIKI